MKRIGRVLIITAAAAALMSLGMPSALAAVPTISSFSPSSGPVGTVVTINGTSFINPLVTAVTFPTGANTMSFTVVSDTKITATVPSTASGSGPISVSNASGTAVSAAAFTVTVLASNGRIAFTCPGHPTGGICTIRPDGTGLINVTVDGIYPSWSPDGWKIAFTSLRDGDPEIYVMNADGTGVQRLTFSPGRDVTPSWSPDGTKIVFSSTRTGDEEIFTMNADGTDQQQLTFEPGLDVWPKYSPDGTKIAFAEQRATWAVYTIPSNGGTPTKLTPDFLNASDPDWSPDGTRFVFVNNFLTASPSSIFTMNVDGSDIAQLTHNPNESEYNPNWSPDGTKIDFWTTAVIPATEQAALASAAAPPFPGNNQILAAMLAGDIWVMNANGSNLRDLTNSPGMLDLHPDWGIFPGCTVSSGVSMFSECDFGFESPILGDGNFTYATTGSPWTFSGAGISSNNSGFTDSQVAPQGVQVAFLQGVGSFSQSISGFRAGTKYALTFSAAQRLNFGGIQDFAVLLDGTLLGTFTPASTGYQDMSVSFSTSTGTHTLTFQGLNTAGGDDTAFVDNVRIA